MFLHDCLSHTTAHGVPHLVDKRDNTTSRLIWIIILLASSAVFCYHSWSMTRKYIDQETVVLVDLDGTKFIVPDIYICNDNPFSKELISKHIMNGKEEFDLINKSLAIEIPKNTFGQNLVDLIYYNRQVQGFSKDLLLNLLSNRSLTDIPLYYISLNGAQYTTRSIFDQVFNPYHSFCYKLKDQFKRNIFTEGSLTFTFYTDQYKLNVWPFKVDYATVPTEFSHSVYLVNPGEYPHREATRVNIERGMKTNIQVTGEYYDRLNREKKPCEEERQTVTYVSDWSNTTSKLTYKANAFDCAVEKFQEFLLSSCQCSFGSYPLNLNLLTKKLNGFSQLCWTWETWDEYVCVDPTQKSVESFIANCLHKNPCQMFHYFTQITKQKLWGDLKYSNSRKLDLQYIAVAEDLSLSQVVSECFAQISFHAPKRLSKVWKEYKETYELKDLLSDICGILGFYVGVSVVTVLEIFGYLGRLIYPRISVKRDEYPVQLERTCM